MGLNVQENNDITYRVWAPAAKGLTFFGDFNGWNRDEFRCEKDGFGQFNLTIKANPDGSPRIQHNSKVKIQVEGPNGNRMDRNSPWSIYAV